MPSWSMMAAARTRPIPGRASSSSTILIRAMASSVSPELMTSAMVSSPDLSRSLAVGPGGPGGGGLVQGVGTLLRGEGSQAH